MMRRYCELRGVKQPYNHHDWREAIGCALLDPTTWTTKNLKSPPEKSSKRKRSVESSTRAPRFDLAALTTDGRLSRRLDREFDHMPIPTKKPNTTCQLHNLAMSEMCFQGTTGCRTGVMLCRGCNTNICIKCWQLYHECEDLEAQFINIVDPSYLQ